MSINATPFRFPPPSSTPRAPIPPRCTVPRHVAHRPRFSFPHAKKLSPAPTTKTPPSDELPRKDNASQSNTVADLRSKIPRLEFSEPDNVQCDLDQGFEEIDLQNGLSDTVTSPTSDPIAVDKENKVNEDENDSSEENFAPNPDDFPGILYDLLDDWTKKTTVTNEISFLHTPYPAKYYKYTYPRYKLRTFFPKNCEMYIIINYVLGRTNTIIFLTSSCLVLDRYVVNAWLIVYASLILCFDILQYSRGLFPKLFPRKTYEQLHVKLE